MHFPQVRVIGALGMPLLDWLDRCALPEEARMADAEYARAVAAEFVDGLVRAGTTTALVFGAHFAPAVDCLFEQAAASGLRVSAGLVVSDRLLRPELLTSPGAGARPTGSRWPARWHRKDRLRYAVTPRFSLSCTGAAARVLRGAAARGGRGAVHLARQREHRRGRHRARAVPRVHVLRGHLPPGTGCSGGAACSRTTCTRPTPSWTQLAAAGASVAHCPSSNSALGSGLFPLRRHVEHGVRVALGTDVGAGTSFSLLREGLQSYFMQALLGAGGLPLTAAHMLYLATAAGAAALDLDEQVGDLSVGKQFDAVWVGPGVRQHPGRGARARRRRRRRAGQGVRAGRPVGRAAGVGRRGPGGGGARTYVELRTPSRAWRS